MKKLLLLTCSTFIFLSQTSAQFVGIGTASPFGKLQVNHKGVASNPALVLFDSTSGTGSEIRFVKQGITTAFNFNINSILTGVASTSFWKFNAGNNPAMTINGNGHMYIGSGTPNYVGRFNIDGSANFTDNILMNGDAGQVGQPLVSNSEDFGAPSWYPNAYFLSSGKVGIGTDIPAAKLQINHLTGSITPTLTLFDSTGGTGSSLAFFKQNFIGNMSIQAAITGNAASGNALNFAHSGVSPTMTIKGDSKVGINNTSPANALDVVGDVNFTGKIKVSSDAGTPGQVLVSNGPGANPEWKASSFPSSERAWVMINAGGLPPVGSAFQDTVDLNGIDYNTSTADINLSSDRITINKSGLYHFQGVLNIGTGALSISSIPARCRIALLDDATHVAMFDDIIEIGQTTFPQGTFVFSSDRYITAGSVLCLFVIVNNVLAGSGATIQTAPFSQNYFSFYLISE